MVSANFQLHLFGAFMYVVDTANSKVTILFLDGRQSSLASDNDHFIDSHVPVIEVNINSIQSPNVTGMLDFIRDESGVKVLRSLWFLDRDQITLTPNGNPSKFSPYQNRRPTGLPSPGPIPPKNDDYFGWVVPMTDIGNKLTLNQDSMKNASMSNPGLPIGVSARLELTFGVLTTLECCNDGMGNYDEFAFQKVGDPNPPPPYYGALTDHVKIDLGNLSALDIQRADFWPGDRIEVINLVPSSDPEIIYLWNAPMSSILKKNLPMKDAFVPHFELMYKVVGNPPSPLLVPRRKRQGPGPDFANVSCPPAKFNL